MNFTFSAKPSKAPVLIVLHEDQRKKIPPKALSCLSQSQKAAVKLASDNDFIPASGLFAVTASPLVLLHVLGKKEDVKGRDMREAGEQVFAAVGRHNLQQLIVCTDATSTAHAVAYREGVLLGSYRYLEWKGKEHEKEMKKRKELKKVIFFGSEQKGESKRLKTMIECFTFTSDLVNAPPRQANPDHMEKLARSIAKEAKKVKLTVLKEKELKKLGCEGLIFVGLGSNQESRLIVLEYKGGGKEAPLMLVGKGITYDTGGLSLKPPRYMQTMKQDLGGAATVLGAFRAVALSGAKKNIIAVVPTAENNVDALSYKPDDILRMYNGVTVEVTNTDAEGRLILADALSYASEKFKPRAIVDLATLTGGCAYAVGNDFTAVLGTDKKLVDSVIKSGEETDELMWELPLHQRYKKLLKSSVADIVNSADKLRASTVEGALFLQHFVPEKTPWCHMDIASVAFDEGKNLATGRNVRSLWHFAENY